MKQLFYILFFLISTAATAQTHNVIYGKQDFKDSLKFSKYRNNAAEDSVLTVDRVTGKLKFKLGTVATTTYTNIDSSVVTGTTVCLYSAGVEVICFTLPTAPGDTTIAGIDSFIVTGNQGCNWKGGVVISCYTISSTINNITNVTNIDSSRTIVITQGTGVDSVIINGYMVCFWDSGISKCWQLNRFFDDVRLSDDSAWYKFYNDGIVIDSVPSGIKNVGAVWPISYDGVDLTTSKPFNDSLYVSSLVLHSDSLFSKQLTGDSSFVGIMSSTGGSSGVDSIAGHDSLIVVYNHDATIDTLVLRGSSGGSSFDSTYIYALANTKQNQLNGTGFVKATGTTITYDNTTYQPAGTYLTPSDSAFLHNKLITSFAKNGTRDSVILTLNDGTRYAVKDSTGSSGGGGVTKAQLPFIISATGDTVSRRFNVMDYIPVGTNITTTDVTVYVQNAINACTAAGGGDVFFPLGVYNIGGSLQSSVGGVNMRGQLYIPTTTLANRFHIRLIGEGMPTFTPVGASPNSSLSATLFPNTSGVVLKSTLTTGGDSAAIIGSGINPTTVYNYVYLTVENIAFQVKNNPRGSGPEVGGVNASWLASLQVTNCTAYIDTSSVRSTQPVYKVAGFVTPNNSSETMNNLTNTLSVGLWDGYVIGEHVELTQSQAAACYNAFTLKSGTHPSHANKINAYWCKNWVFVNSDAAHVATFNVDQIGGEWYNNSKWFDYSYLVKDTINMARGTLFYSIINAGTTGQPDNTLFAKSGAANYNMNAIDSGIATRGPNIFKGQQRINLKSTTDTLVSFYGTNGTTNIGFISKPTGNVRFSNKNFSPADPAAATISNGAVFGVYDGGDGSYSGIGLAAVRNGGYDMTFQSGAAAQPGGFRWYYSGTEAMSLTRVGNLLMNTTTDISTSIMTLNSTTKGILIPRMTRSNFTSFVGGILTGTINNAGSGGTNGTYTNQVFTNVNNSAGASASVNITIAGNIVTAVTISAAGFGYAVGDTLTLSTGSITGFKYVVTGLTGAKGTDIYDTTLNAHQTWTGTSIQNDFITTSAATQVLTYGTDYIFTGTTSTAILPIVSASILGRQNSIKIKNRGSGTITLNSNTGSTIYDTTTQSTISITAGQGIELMPDGTYFLVMYKQ